jgi:hypothetical protein
MRFPENCECIPWFSKLKWFAYVVFFICACLFTTCTSKYVPNKWVIRCTNMLQYNGYFTQWLRITQLRNKSQSQALLSPNCPFGKTSVRQNVRSAKCLRQNAFRQNVRVPSEMPPAYLKANIAFALLSNLTPNAAFTEFTLKDIIILTYGSV